jgi:SHS2 domain-containing protein
MPYNYLEHRADLVIQGIGATSQEAFAEGAQAMLAAMANVAKVECKQTYPLQCTAPDIAALFVEWLNEILYQREINDVLLSCARVTLLERSDRGWTLEGVACGEPLDLERHETYIEVKAATYSGLEYIATERKCIVQCVLDV